MFEERFVIAKNVEMPRSDKNVVKFSFSDGCCWHGAKLKDFYKNEDWENIIKVGTKFKVWTIQGSCVVGLQVWYENRWKTAWYVGNNFDTKAVARKREDAYCNFIKSEGKKIAKWIDRNKSLKQIDKLISDGHSGNTYGCALSIGISEAKNRRFTEKIRKAHNKKYGVKESKGVVNPAILTIKED